MVTSVARIFQNHVEIFLIPPNERHVGKAKVTTESVLSSIKMVVTIRANSLQQADF